jgi:DNA-binding MarR family transcriptional regulator
VGDDAERWNDVSEVAAAAEALYAAMRRVRNIPDDSDEALSVAQMTLIEPLLDEQEMPVGQLAARAGVSVPTATRMLKSLEGRGLLQRHRSPDDDRIVLIRLSPSGSQIATRRRAMLRRRQATRLARLSPRERAEMARQLRKLALLITAPDLPTETAAQPVSQPGRRR